MTDVTVIPRINIPESFLPEVGLARHIKKVLGYAFLMKEEKKYQDEIKLLRACGMVGLRPFETKAVRAYMNETRDELRKVTGGNRSYWWDNKNINEYNKPIPIEVLKRAVALREQNKRIEFSVWEMHEHQDPFLMAKLGKAKLFVAVWDEKEFNAKFE